MPRAIAPLRLDSGLLIPAGAAAGRVLTSDGSGNGAWAAPAISDADVVGLRSGIVVHGGGTLTFDATGRLLWSARFIVMALGRGATLATNGYWDITVPPATTVITGVGGSTGDTATAAGVLIPAWHTLYYILPLAATSTSLPANFRLVTYTADVTIPSNWVPLAFRNGDSMALRVIGRDTELLAGQIQDQSAPVPRLSLSDTHMVAANKDGIAATLSLRTLGTGAQQAAAGNDARFSDSRAPSGTAGGDLSGTYPNPGIAAGVIVNADINASAAIAMNKLDDARAFAMAVS